MTPEIQEMLDSRAVVVASVSGGKDSTAMSLHLTELGIEHRRVFMDTGWEADVTYDYLRNVLPKHIGAIEEIRGPLLMDDLVRKKGTFPSRLRRFCTEELKVKPMIKYISDLQDVVGDCVNVVGIRREESAARSATEEWEWSDAFDCQVWRPLVHWTIDDVIAIHKRHGVPPNPLYLMGATRVGCWPCIHSRKSEVRLVADKDPGRINRLRQLESDVAARATERYAARGEEMKAPPSFFQAPIPEDVDGAPCSFCGGDGKAHGEHAPADANRSEPCPVCKGTTAKSSKHYPPWPIDRIVEWSKTSRGGRQVDFFGGDATANEGCMRWGLSDTATEEKP